MKHNLPASLVRDIKRFGVEETESGLYVPRANVSIGGVFEYEHRRAGEIIDVSSSHNLVVNEGLNHILNVVLHGATATPTWYVGLFEGNYTPLAADTAATFPTSATECTAYSEATRQEYVEAAASGQSITNSAARATFTFNASKTIYGAFLTSVSTKGGTTGVLLAADRGAVAKAVVSADQLLVAYTLSITAS